MNKIHSIEEILKAVRKALSKIFIAVLCSAMFTVIVLVGYSKPVMFIAIFSAAVLALQLRQVFTPSGPGMSGLKAPDVCLKKKRALREILFTLTTITIILVVVLGVGFLFTALIKLYDTDYKKSIRLALYGVSTIGGTIYALMKKDSDFLKKIEIIGVCTGIASGIDGIMSNLPDFLDK